MLEPGISKILKSCKQFLKHNTGRFYVEITKTELKLKVDDQVNEKISINKKTDEISIQ